MHKISLFSGCLLGALLSILPLSSRSYSQDCEPSLLYSDIKDETEELEKKVRKSLGSRPGMKIENVLWIGSGLFKLICNGQYSQVRSYAPSMGPPVDRSKIDRWQRGDGTADRPGKYIFQIDQTVVSIPVLSSHSDQLSDYGVSIAAVGDSFNTPRPSVMATYLYGSSYFDDFVLPENGPRLERHPNDHLVTLISRVDDKKSYFVVGKVVKNALSIVAVELQPGITLRIRGNTVHTNDYVTGVVQEIYPKTWGVDEVRLVNRLGMAVRLLPFEKDYL